MAFEFRSNNVRKINLIAKKNISFGSWLAGNRRAAANQTPSIPPSSFSGQKKKASPAKASMTENEPMINLLGF
jgi:hypothetical protein